MVFRRSRTWFLALPLLLMGAGRAAAQEPPAFLIERIVVEGASREAPRQIVLSESLLHEGSTYSEAELRAAVYRVKRLPFVVDADMALRKGSTRGAYELVITIEPATAIAFAIDAGILGRDAASAPRGADRVTFGAAGTLTARRFVGAHGLVFGSLQAFDDDLGSSTVQLGYTRYGLFGRGGYATIAASTAIGEDQPSVADNLQGSLQLGIPLAGNHALRFELARTHVEFRQRFTSPEGEVTGTRVDATFGGMEWIYDSTDDPLFATEGLRTTTSAGLIRQRQRFSAGPDLVRTDIELLTFGAAGRRYRRLTPRQSVALDGELAGSREVFTSGLGFGTTSLSRHTEHASLAVIHAIDLWGDQPTRSRGDLRLETGLGLARYWDSGELGPDVSLLELRGALLFRNRWGLIKLSATYRDALSPGAYR